MNLYNRLIKSCNYCYVVKVVIFAQLSNYKGNSNSKLPNIYPSKNGSIMKMHLY
jgi:hypothetical protein